MDLKEYKFIYKTENKEKVLITNSTSLLPLSSKSKLINYLDDECFNELYFVNDDDNINIIDAFILNGDPKQVGTFHFVFKSDTDIDVETLKQELNELKERKIKDKNEKINSIFNIVNKYHPLFAYILFAYKDMSKINTDSVDYPFIYINPKEYKPDLEEIDDKDLSTKDKVKRYFTSAYTYLALFLALIAVNTGGFILNIGKGFNITNVFFIIIFVCCFALCVLVDYYRHQSNTEDKMFFKNDISFYLTSLLGYALGVGIYYLLNKYLLKTEDMSKFYLYVLGAVGMTLLMFVISKIVSYFIYKARNKNKEGE